MALLDTLGIGGAALGLGGSLASIFGQKSRPTYTPVSLEAETAKAIGMNISNLPSATKLATDTSLANQDIVNQMLRKAIPEYDRLQKESLAVIEPMLRGEIPKDVQQQMQRSAAAAGIAGGTSGSQFAQYGALRNLGLTSLQLSTQGLDATEKWL